MNIFMLTSVPMVPPWDQGDKNLAYALTSALPEHRFQVLTACGRPAPLGANLERVSVYRDGYPALVQKARVYWRLLRISDGPAICGPQSARHIPDLYHLIYRPYALSSWFCRLLPEFRRRPTVHTVPATADGRPLSRRLFFADRLVALSEYGRRTLQRLGLENVVRIPPGIEVAPWMALSRRSEQLKARLGVAGRPVILFPGHYGPGYGARVMLDALWRIVAQVPNVQVIFACRLRAPGDRERERAARQMVTGTGLTYNVRFYNTVADMRTLIGASDLTVLPLQTMRDKVDIPTTLLESLAAGKPIVISELPPMNELVQGNEGAEVGLAVPPGDSKALAQAVVALLKDAGLREHMGKRGQTLVREHFDIRQVARQYEKLYQEMVL